MCTALCTWSSSYSKLFKKSFSCFIGFYWGTQTVHNRREKNRAHDVALFLSFKGYFCLTPHSTSLNHVPLSPSYQQNLHFVCIVLSDYIVCISYYNNINIILYNGIFAKNNKNNNVIAFEDWSFYVYILYDVIQRRQLNKIGKQYWIFSYDFLWN